ncbi:MAG: bifunctional metallophosphatase/5'-nucleotidase [Pseudomonadota bacterium]
MYTLEFLHVTDQEGSSADFGDISRTAAILNALEAQDLGDDGIMDNTLRLSSGDAILPGAFFDISDNVFGSAGIADIQIQNELGFKAIALGNHEFDFGTGTLGGLIDGSVEGDFSALTTSDLAGQDFTGTDFPYLSSNLNFSTDGNLAPLTVNGGQPPQGKVVTSSTIADVNGEMVGIVGATTPTLASISSPGSIGISPSPFGAPPSDSELDALAAVIQAEVDALLAANEGLNKVVLLAHMQQISIEYALAEKLENVDVIFAGGSNTRLFDDDDRVRSGDTDQVEYPQQFSNAGGTTTLVVNTDGSYKYVGRLVIDFDNDGNIIPESYDPEVSGAYATDAQGLTDLNAAGLTDPEIDAILAAMEDEIVNLEGSVFGVAENYLLRDSGASTVSGDALGGERTQETALGNLTADANLFYAEELLDDTFEISLKNGGGIRAPIGETITPAGATQSQQVPNQQITDSDGNIVKPEGGISQFDISSTLAFNNDLVVLTLTAEEIVALLEHGVAAIPEVSGRFPQLSGVKFSYDPGEEEGAQIQNAGIFDDDGTLLAELVVNGEIVNSDALYDVVTLEFLARPRFDEDGNYTGGGDGYPFVNYNTDALNEFDGDITGTEAGDPEVIDRLNVRFLNSPVADDDSSDFMEADSTAEFAPTGTEQDALAEYLNKNFNPFSGEGEILDISETPASEDERIQNLVFRDDAVFGTSMETGQSFRGGFDNDIFEGTDAADRFLLRYGMDEATGNGGADLFFIDSRYVLPGDKHVVTDFDTSEGDIIKFRYFDVNREITSDADLDFYVNNGFATILEENGNKKSISFQNLDENFGSDNARFIGSRGDDVFDGKAGTDRFVLRFGSDTATGGADSDTFLFDARYVGTGSQHMVTDLNFDEGDMLTLRFFASQKVEVGSQSALSALDGEDFATVQSTGGSTLLTLTNDDGQSMEITLFQVGMI